MWPKFTDASVFTPNIQALFLAQAGKTDLVVRVFIKYLITLGYLLRTKRLRAYSL